MAEIHNVRRWLEVLVRRGGSDLFLVGGLPPSIRIAGRIHKLDEESVDGPDIEKAILPALSAQAALRYQTMGAADSSLRVEGLGRFRINLHHERGRPAATIRALPPQPPRFSELSLSPNVLGLSRIP